MRMESDNQEWRRHLRSKGYDLPGYPDIYRPSGDGPASPARYAAEDSDTAFLADRFMSDISKRPAGWFAFLAFIRPHPPLVAPAPYNTMYDPVAMPPAQRSNDNTDWHPFLAATRAATPISRHIEGFPDFAQTDENTALLRALYFGLATEVDDHIGRIVSWLKSSGEFDNTIIVLTSDHGELLGDYGLWGNNSFYDAAFHVPLLIRDPAQEQARGHKVAAGTESVDVMPTILELIGAEKPQSVDGCSLSAFLGGHEPGNWRSSTFSELDFGNPLNPTLCQRQLNLPVDAANLAVLRNGRHRFVQFAGDLPQILFDSEQGGETRNLAKDAKYFTTLLDLSRQMLCHRMQNPDGTFAQTMVTSEGVKIGSA
jgi:arylsulfatase A-like enzyme